MDFEEVMLVEMKGGEVFIGTSYHKNIPLTLGYLELIKDHVLGINK